MSDLISLFKKDLLLLIDELENKNVINNFNKSSISIDHSSKSKKGDLSTNILIILLKKNIDKNFDVNNYTYMYISNLSYINNVDIASAGFINIFIKKKYLKEELRKLISKNKLTKIDLKNQKKINIEFVSANPTGPIHVAHIRGAVIGDVLASILQAVGHEVTREYYVNDAGSQINTLGNSVYKRYLQLFDIDATIGQSEYPGQYIIEIAKKIKILDGKKWLNKDSNITNKYFKSFAVNFLIGNIKSDLSLLNINFDSFVFESQIVKDGIIKKVFDVLKEKDLIYEGFLEKPLGDNNEDWEPRKQLLFRSSNFLDDSDRAFKKSNGEWTYFANDSAYHYNKYSRGYDKLINIWGADHIGYIKRMKSVVDSISGKKNYLDIFICQIVRLIKNGTLLKMSKRDNNFISLKELYNEVGKDPIRYFMISSKSESPMDFDMNKVIEKNKDNQVFYCQYAYARASSVMRKSREYNIISSISDAIELFDYKKISSYEWDIIIKILSWPYVLKQSADSQQPHRITNYLEELCSLFHAFWNKGKEDNSLRMIDENNINQTISKLIWVESFRLTLKEIFKIIGIDSPETM